MQLISRYFWTKKAGIVLLMLFSFGGLKVFAQGNQHLNLLTYDQKKLHYGFLLAGNFSNYRLKHTSYFVNSSPFSTVRSEGSTGFTLGFVTNYRLNDHMDLRLLPSVAFYFKEVLFSPGLDGDEVDRQVFNNSFIEFPLLLKYKSKRRGNARMYVVGGIKPAIEVGAKKKEKSDEDLRTNTFDLSLEAGVGTDIYFELFKFAPELRFSYGLTNLLNKDNNFYTNNLDALNTYTVTLLFLFE